MDTFLLEKANLKFFFIMLSGFQPLIVSLYNLSWTLQSTVREIDKIQLSLRGSPQATIGGMFYLLGFSSSLYHLVLLGQQRIYAINWPIRYKMQAVKSVYKGIGVVWILSLLSATTPGELWKTASNIFSRKFLDPKL